MSPTDPTANDHDQKLLKCISDALDLDLQSLRLSSKIGDFPEWDSLGHIKIYFAIQQEFAVAIPLEAAGNVRSVSDWANAIKSQSRV